MFYEIRKNNELRSQIIWLMCTIFIVYILQVFISPLTFIKVNGVNYWHLNDDQMITMRVAYNIFKYGHPYFNNGESIAANTSLFWPYILSIFFYFGEQWPKLPIISITSIFLSGFSLYFSGRIIKSYAYKIIFIIVVSLSPTYLEYAASGWEHIGQLILISTAMYFIVSKSQKEIRIPTVSLILTLLATAIRPDTIFIYLLILIKWSYDNIKKNKFIFFMAILISCLVLLIYYNLMINIYGDWRPNTYYLKVGGVWENFINGFRYNINPLLSGVTLPIAILLIIFSRFKIDRFIAFLTLVQVVSITFIGGDVFYSGRFYIFILPTLIALAVRNVEQSRFNWIKVIYCAILFFWMMSYFAKLHIFHRTPIYGIYDHLRLVSFIKNNINHSEGSIGLHMLGVGYHLPNYHIVDFLGKAESYIAHTSPKVGPIGHNKYDYDYVLKKYDIAVAPAPSQRFLEMKANNFRVDNTGDLFVDDMISKFALSKKYIFMPNDCFNNLEFGAFVRRDVLARICAIEKLKFCGCSKN